jgi:hypothetical protein
MRPLNRPMFRYGGPIKEGVMSGIKERVPYQKGGSYLKNLTGAIANFYNPIKKAKPIQKIIQKIKPTGVPKFKKENMYDLPVGMRGKISDRVSKIPFMERAGMFVKQNPIQTAIAAPYIASGAISAAPPVAKGIAGLTKAAGLQAADLLVPDFIFDQDQYFKDKEQAKIDEANEKSKLTANEKRIKELEALLAADTSVNQGKTPEELRKERIDKYRDIVDIKGMNKEAAYNSLIAASQAIGQSQDFKGDLKSGKLISDIIASTSKAFDKPKATKDAIDTLILKGEIQADIAAGKPSAIEQQIDAVSKNLKVDKVTATKMVLKQPTDLRSQVTEDASLMKSIPTHAIIASATKKQYPNAEILLSETEVKEKFGDKMSGEDIIKSLDIFKTAADPSGIYVVGKEVIQIDSKGNTNTIFP